MLPFLDPEDDMYVNLSIVMIIIGTLGQTNRGSLKINNTRLHIFLYLLKNPVVLNKFLDIRGKGAVLLSHIDSYSVTSVSPNIDPLFDREALKALISVLVAKNLVTVIYKKNDGFFYILSEQGMEITSILNEDYFENIRSMCEELKITLSISETQLNQALNQIIRKESA